MNFHAIQLQFRFRSSKSGEELAQQPDQHHRVVSPTATTIPRWWSGEWKYDIFFLSNFNCLTKALILRHLYRLERLYNCASLFTSKTLLNTKTGLTPQDALASIIALAVISLFESILFSVNSLKLQCCKNQSVPGLQMHLAPSSCKPLRLRNFPIGQFLLQLSFCQRTWILFVLKKNHSHLCRLLNRAVTGRSRYNCHCEGLFVIFKQIRF